MDRKVIKLEAAYGSERQFVIVKRSRELIVRDLLEEIQKVFKIPVEEQVIFHKGTNLSDFVGETLENLGVENNNLIRVTRDPNLPNRSPPRTRYVYASVPQTQTIAYVPQLEQPAQIQYVQQQPPPVIVQQPPVQYVQQPVQYVQQYPATGKYTTTYSDPYSTYK
jgi:hypothetical protein